MDKMDLNTILTSKPFMSVAMMMSMKYLGIDVPVPTARVAYAVAMVANMTLIIALLMRVRAGPEGKKFTAKEIDTATNTVVVKPYTWKTYDEKQAMTQLRTFALGMAITTAMHAWQGYTTPLVLAWLQPIFLVLDPLFQSRVLGVDREVPRPSTDPFMKMQIDALEQKQQQEAKQEKAKSKSKAKKVT